MQQQCREDASLTTTSPVDKISAWRILGGACVCAWYLEGWNGYRRHRRRRCCCYHSTVTNGSVEGAAEGVGGREFFLPGFQGQSRLFAFRSIARAGDWT